MLSVLNAHRVEYVIVGGIGSLIHGATRATQDADIVIADDLKNVQNLSRALHTLRARVRTDTDSIDDRNAEQAAGGRGWHTDDLEGTFLSVQTDAGPLDILPSLRGPHGRVDYETLIEDARTVVFTGDDAVTIKVASLQRIIESKRAADRPKDHEALPELEALHNQQQPPEPDLGLDLF